MLSITTLINILLLKNSCLLAEGFWVGQLTSRGVFCFFFFTVVNSKVLDKSTAMYSIWYFVTNYF